MARRNRDRAAGDSPAPGKCDRRLFATTLEITTPERVTQPPLLTFVDHGSSSWQTLGTIADRVVGRLAVEDSP